MNHESASTKIRTWLAVLAMGLLTMSNPRAATFEHTNLTPQAKGMLIRGDIETGDYDRFVDFVRRDPERYVREPVVAIDSMGGSVSEAMRIGDVLRKTYKVVIIEPTKFGRCASACFVMYVSATEHWSGHGGLGIHRPYLRPQDIKNLTLSQGEEREHALYKEVREFLQQREVPAKIIDEVFSLASSEIHWLDDDEVQSLGARSNWYDQFLVSRCNLDKDLEPIALSETYTARGLEPPENVKVAIANNDAARMCARQLGRQEARRFLETSLRIAVPE